MSWHTSTKLCIKFSSNLVRQSILVPTINIKNWKMMMKTPFGASFKTYISFVIFKANVNPRLNISTPIKIGEIKSNNSSRNIFKVSYDKIFKNQDHTEILLGWVWDGTVLQSYLAPAYTGPTGLNITICSGQPPIPWSKFLEIIPSIRGAFSGSPVRS